MKKLAYWVWGYALLLVIGGIMGFLKAGSLVSLIMSSVFGILLAIGGVLFWKDHSWAPKINMGLLSLILVVFGFRFFSTMKPVPGVLAIATLIVLWVVTSATRKHEIT